jgi:hypothetical protein
MAPTNRGIDEKPSSAKLRASGEAKSMHIKTLVGAMLGTTLEVYDLAAFALLAVYFSGKFFPSGNETSGLLPAFATFGVGFVVRPLGGLLFGALGDRIGRKSTLLSTMTLMGLSTAAIGVLPTYDQVGWLASILLVICRLLQGLSIGGEYGGAAIYVAEHTPAGSRGLKTGWFQSSAFIGQLLPLGVILSLQNIMGLGEFASWGWRIPFLLSLLLLACSIYIRLRLDESPVFQDLLVKRMVSRAPVKESIGRVLNLKRILPVTAICAGQGVAGYVAGVYQLYFVINVLKLDASMANQMLAISVSFALPFGILAGKLSDHIGRKWLIVGTLLVAGSTFIPIFQALVHFGNPALERFQAETKISVASDGCVFRVFVTSTTPRTPCDRVKDLLNRSGLSYTSLPSESVDVLTRIGKIEIRGFNASALDTALRSAGFRPQGDVANMNRYAVQALMMVLSLYAAVVFGPLAAFLVEQFPASIRYTSLGIAYNLGTGWFGGMTPFLISAISLQTGNIYQGLSYAIGVTIAAFVVGALFTWDHPHIESQS